MGPFPSHNPPLTPHPHTTIIIFCIIYTPEGEAVASHLRRKEVQEIDISSYAEYVKQLESTPENITLEYKYQNTQPAQYRNLVAQNILPPWPGPGILIRMKCAPSHRSDTNRSNWKTPTIFILRSDQKNPLNCTNTFKRFGSMTCYNCPSSQGNIGACCHIGKSFVNIKSIKSLY